MSSTFQIMDTFSSLKYLKSKMAGRNCHPRILSLQKSYITLILFPVAMGFPYGISTDLI